MSKLPGINSKNIFALLNKADNLIDVLDMNEDTLCEILNSKQNGSDLYQALHGKIELPKVDKKDEKKKPFKRFKSKK